MQKKSQKTAQQCKAEFQFEGKPRQCGSWTKHSSGYCYGHRNKRPDRQQ